MSDEIIVTAQPAQAERTGPIAFPRWRVELDGEDLSDALAPRLMRLQVSERRGDEADQLDIELDDSGQTLAIPKAGAVLDVSLGWYGGGGTSAGLIDKGAFIVDESEHQSFPDKIIIRARSADFTAQWRKIRDQTWRDKTLSDVLNEIAGRQGLTLKIADSLANIAVKLVTQSRESDMVLFKRLGYDYDAVAQIKNGRMLFIPMSGGQNANADNLPTVNIARNEGDGHSYRIAAREDYSGVVARWHDKKAAAQKQVQSNSRSRDGTSVPKISKPSTTAGSDDNPKIIKKIFPTEAEAQRAADAEWQRIQRAPRSLSVNLALGRPDIDVESPAIVSGFHPEIDSQNWIVTEASHTLDEGGLTTSLSFEIPDKAQEADDESEAV